MTNKKSASSPVGDMKRKTRKSYSSEEKIRIIIEGMRGGSVHAHKRSISSRNI